MAAAALITHSANAQVPDSSKVTVVVPEKSTTTSTTTKTDSTITGVAPQQPAIVGEVRPVTSSTVPRAVPADPATVRGVVPAEDPIVTGVIPEAPGSRITGSATITTTRDPGIVVRRLDPVTVQRHLLVSPQAITVTPEQRISLDRTVTIESRSQPVRRAYNVERSVVIVEDQGQSRELPYMTVPVLFVVDTAELLDAESLEALGQTASIINAVTKTDPNALFDVEGHTSAEGSAEHNMLLSAERSKRIYAELTQRYGVPATALTAHGYGQNFAMYPNGTERERQEDRRVLVVRTR